MATPTATTASAPLGYARRALNHEKDAWVEFKVDHMSIADALYWDATIQRDIAAEGIREKAPERSPRGEHVLLVYRLGTEVVHAWRK